MRGWGHARQAASKEWHRSAGLKAVVGSAGPKAIAGSAGLKAAAGSAGPKAAAGVMALDLWWSHYVRCWNRGGLGSHRARDPTKLWIPLGSGSHRAQDPTGLGCGCAHHPSFVSQVFARVLRTQPLGRRSGRSSGSLRVRAIRHPKSATTPRESVSLSRPAAS